MAEYIFHADEPLSSVDPEILRLSERVSKVSQVEEVGRRSWSNGAAHMWNRALAKCLSSVFETWLIMSPNMRIAVDIVNNNVLETVDEVFERGFPQFGVWPLFDRVEDSSSQLARSQSASLPATADFAEAPEVPLSQLLMRFSVESD